MDKSVYTHKEYQQLLNNLNKVMTNKRFWMSELWRRSIRVVGAVIVLKALLVFLRMLDTQHSLTGFIQVTNRMGTLMLWLLPVEMLLWCWLFYRAKTALQKLDSYWASHVDDQLVTNEFDNVNRFQLLIEFSDVFAGWSKKGGWQLVHFEDVAQPYKTFWRVRHNLSWVYYIPKHGLHISHQVK